MAEQLVGIAGVVVSCKIPILATRVRFPGDAYFFSTCFLFDWTLLGRVVIAALSIQGIDDEMLKFLTRFWCNNKSAACSEEALVINVDEKHLPAWPNG